MTRHFGVRQPFQNFGDTGSEAGFFRYDTEQRLLFLGERFGDQ